MNMKIIFTTITILMIIAAGFAFALGTRRESASADGATAPAAPNPAAETLVTPNDAAVGTDSDVFIAAANSKAAPELAKGKWINSDPLTLGGLRGRVVMVEFWTFGCYNCINTLPTIKRFDSAYHDRGLTIIGIETPETEAERSFENLSAAVKKRGIDYPVLTDYGSTNWENYNVIAWPTILILDKQGRIRYKHIGEGAYDTEENVIKALLAEDDTGRVARDDEFDGVAVVKTEAEWRSELTPIQYNVLREEGTERAFTGKYAGSHGHGDYYCAACHLKLFSSKTKFESGTGWPSFYEVINRKNVIEKTDNSLGETRTAVECRRCRSHLGHVFADGPKPTGLRYCMNSAALTFEPAR